MDKFKDIIPNHLGKATWTAPRRPCPLEGRAGRARRAGPQGKAPACGMHRARLHRRLGLEGLPEDRHDLRLSAAGRHAGIRQAGAPLFTPSTKAELGQHDQNISPAEAARLLLGEDVARKVQGDHPGHL